MTRAYVTVDSTDYVLPELVREATLPFRIVPGLTEGGTGDNTATIQAGLDAVETEGGGTLMLPSGNYAIAGEVIVPEGVDLIGVGGHLNVTSVDHMTRLVATNAAAKVTFEGSGGMSGNFVVDGDDLATGPLFKRAAGADRSFQNITVTLSTGEALRVEEAQNDSWTQVHALHSVGPLLIMDKGAGGHKFNSCEYGGTETWHLVIENSATGGIAGNIGPSYNTWERCFLEYSKFGSADIFSGCLDIHSGQENTFRDCILSAVGNEATVAAMRVNTDAAVGTPASRVLLDNCVLASPTAGATRRGIVQTAGNIRLHGYTRFESFTSAWKFDGGSASVADEVAYNGVTNRWDPASGGTVGNVVNVTSRPLSVQVESTDSYAARILQYGDTGTRLDITPLGRLSFGSGSGAPDIVLYRVLANLLGLFPGDSFQVDGTYNGGMVLFGTNRLWVAATGELRIKNGVPSADTDGSHVAAPTSVNAQTGTTYTFVRADDAKFTTLSNAAAITATVPPNSSVAYPVGTEIRLAQIGAGQVTVAPGAGVTVNGTPGLKTRAQYSRATLIKTATDTWLLSGDIAA